MSTTDGTEVCLHTRHLVPIVQQTPYALKHLPPVVQGDHLVVLAAVKKNGLVLRYAADELRADRGVVRAAVESNGNAIRHVKPPLSGDHRFLQELVALSPRSLKCIPHLKLNDEVEFVKKVLGQNGLCLEYVRGKFRSDPQIVRAAVTQNGKALQYATGVCMSDREIVRAAVESDGNALQYACDALREDKAIVRAAVENDGNALQYARYALREDKAIVRAAVENYAKALQYATGVCMSDREIVRAAVESDGNALQYACDTLREDKAIARAAVTQNGKALVYAMALKGDEDIVRAAVAQNGDALRHAHVSVVRKHDVWRVAMAQKEWAAHYTDKSLPLICAEQRLALARAAAAGDGIGSVPADVVELVAGRVTVPAAVTAYVGERVRNAYLKNHELIGCQCGQLMRMRGEGRTVQCGKCKLWLSKDATTVWQCHWSPAYHRSYWYNTRTRTSQWTDPMPSLALRAPAMLTEIHDAVDDMVQRVAEQETTRVRKCPARRRLPRFFIASDRRACMCCAQVHARKKQRTAARGALVTQ